MDKQAAVVFIPKGFSRIVYLRIFLFRKSLGFWYPVMGSLLTMLASKKRFRHIIDIQSRRTTTFSSLL